MRNKKIRNAAEFYLWSSSLERSLVRYAWVDIFDYTVAFMDRRRLNGECLDPIYGTFTFHAILPAGEPHMVATREISCACDRCQENVINGTHIYDRHSTLKDTVSAESMERFRCQTCGAPLCVCLEKIQRLRAHYIYRKQILIKPSKYYTLLLIHLLLIR